MALPKHKISKSKRDKRRTHQKLTAPNLTKCPECGETKQPHHACLECGAYRDKNINAPEKD